MNVRHGVSPYRDLSEKAEMCIDKGKSPGYYRWGQFLDTRNKHGQGKKRMIAFCFEIHRADGVTVCAGTAGIIV